MNELLRPFEQDHPRVVMRPHMISTKRDEFVGGFRRNRHTAEMRTVEATVGRWRPYVLAGLTVGVPPPLFSPALFVPSWAAAAENEDIAFLRQMLGELKAENRKLSERLSALEGASTARRSPPAAVSERRAPAATTA